MASLLERLELVIKSKWVDSGRDWAKSAGLSEGYIGTTLKRLREETDAAPGLEVMIRLADAANVSRSWLLLDIGSPRGIDTEDDSIDPDDPIAERAAAIAACRRYLPAEVVAYVRNMQFLAPRPKSFFGWIDTLKAEEDRLSTIGRDAYLRGADPEVQAMFSKFGPLQLGMGVTEAPNDEDDDLPPAAKSAAAERGTLKVDAVPLAPDSATIRVAPAKGKKK